MRLLRGGLVSAVLSLTALACGSSDKSNNTGNIVFTGGIVATGGTTGGAITGGLLTGGIVYTGGIVATGGLVAGLPLQPVQP